MWRRAPGSERALAGSVQRVAKHAGQLVLPYGFADYGTAIALVSLETLLNRLTS